MNELPSNIAPNAIIAASFMRQFELEIFYSGNGNNHRNYIHDNCDNSHCNDRDNSAIGIIVVTSIWRCVMMTVQISNQYNE
jgi:hypothetical protein